MTSDRFNVPYAAYRANVAAAHSGPSIRDRYRQNVADARRDFGLFCVRQRYVNTRLPHDIISLGIGEIAALRLQLAYLPVLKSLDRIERHFSDIIVQLKPVQYAKGKRIQ